MFAHLLGIATVVILFGSLSEQVGGRDGLLVPVALAVVGLGVAGTVASDARVVSRALLLVVAIGGVVALSAFMNPPGLGYGQEKWESFRVTTVLTMAGAVAMFKPRVLSALAFWIVIVGLLLAVQAGLGPTSTGGRAQVDDANPVWLARAIAASVVALVWFGASRRWRWWRVIVLVPILVAGLLATGSRGPAIAALAGSLAVLLAPTDRRSGRVVGVVGIGVLAAVLAPLIPAVANSRMGRFIAQGDPGEEARSQLWRTSLRAIPDHPFGAGLGEWSAVTNSSFRYPHNIFLEVFVEQGWLAGMLLAFLVFALLRRLWRASGADDSLQLALALLVTETIHVSTSGDLNARTFFFVVVLSTALLLRHRYAVRPDRQETSVDAPSLSVPMPRERSVTR